MAWDDLDPVTMSQCASNVTVPKADQATAVHAPAADDDQRLRVQRPAPDDGPQPERVDERRRPRRDGRVPQPGQAGIDSEIVSIRNGTHLTYTYIPYVLPANEIGERVAFYYTLAWLDEYLRGGKDALLPASDTAYRRLTSPRQLRPERRPQRQHDVTRRAADISFGAGTYSATQAAADPTNPAAGNVPYEIKGISIPDTLSFYYYSEYSLHDTQAPAVRSDLHRHARGLPGQAAGHALSARHWGGLAV